MPSAKIPVALKELRPLFREHGCHAREKKKKKWATGEELNLSAAFPFKKGTIELTITLCACETYIDLTSLSL